VHYTPTGRVIFVYSDLLQPTHGKRERERERVIVALITLVTHTHALARTPLEEGSARRGGLYPHSPQHTQQTDIHAPGAIRTGDPSKRASLRLRPSGHLLVGGKWKLLRKLSRDALSSIVPAPPVAAHNPYGRNWKTSFAEWIS